MWRMHKRAVNGKYFQLKNKCCKFCHLPSKVSWEFKDIADQKSREKSAVAPSFITVSNNVETLRHTPLVKVNQATVSLVVIDNFIM